MIENVDRKYSVEACCLQILILKNVVGQYASDRVIVVPRGGGRGNNWENVCLISVWLHDKQRNIHSCRSVSFGFRMDMRRRADLDYCVDGRVGIVCLRDIHACIWN